MKHYSAVIKQDAGEKIVISNVNEVPEGSSVEDLVKKVSGTRFEHAVEANGKVRKLWQINAIRIGLDKTANVVFEGDKPEDIEAIVEELS